MLISKSENKLLFIKPQLTDLSISLINSSIDPMQISSFPSSVLQIGSGIPQNLDLERFQSLTFSSHFSNLPSPVDFGFQLIFLFNETILLLYSEAFINHESIG